MGVPTLTIFCREDTRPPVTSSPIPAAPSQYLLDLLAQVPDPRKRRGRRHALAGLLAVGIAAVIAGSQSFAAIGQRAADAGPEVLAVLGAARCPAEESTFRRAVALVSADVLDRVLGAWLHTRAVHPGGRLVIAIDGKTVRGAKDKNGKAPHLVAALAHGIGAPITAAGPAGRSRWRWCRPGSGSTARPRSRSCAAPSPGTERRPSKSSTSFTAVVDRYLGFIPAGQQDLAGGGSRRPNALVMGGRRRGKAGAAAVI